MNEENLSFIDKRRGKVEDKGSQQTKSSNGVEVSSEVFGVGSDDIGVLCEGADGINIDDTNRHHLGRFSSCESNCEK